MCSCAPKGSNHFLGLRGDTCLLLGYHHVRVGAVFDRVVHYITLSISGFYALILPSDPHQAHQDNHQDDPAQDRQKKSGCFLFSWLLVFCHLRLHRGGEYGVLCRWFGTGIHPGCFFRWGQPLIFPIVSLVPGWTPATLTNQSTYRFQLDGIW